MKKEKIPNHVGIILDGNGRWAQERNKDRSYGHKEGFKNLKTLTRYIFDRGVKILSVYAFSTENFNRSEKEVNYLMNLFLKGFKGVEKECSEKDIKIVFSGKKQPLPDKVYKEMKRVEENTKNNSSGIFNICINYGSQYEIIDAINKIIKENKKEITKEEFNKYLYKDLPEIDFLIRTSGEQRISNFMLWQSAYAEFYFPKTYFPDFNEKEFDKAIKIYNKRDRRFGKIKNT